MLNVNKQTKTKKQQKSRNKKKGVAVLHATTSPLRSQEGILRAGRKIMRCSIGKGGIDSKRREGDGITPRGRYKILDVYMRFDRLKKHATPLTIKRISKDMGWCTEPGSPNYNKPTMLPYDGAHEKLLRKDHLYDIVIVLDYNIGRRKSHGGSAIFLHIAKEGYKPTEGCIAISQPDMAWLVPRLLRGSVLRIG